MSIWAVLIGAGALLFAGTLVLQYQGIENEIRQQCGLPPYQYQCAVRGRLEWDDVGPAPWLFRIQGWIVAILFSIRYMPQVTASPSPWPLLWFALLSVLLVVGVALVYVAAHCLFFWMIRTRLERRYPGLQYRSNEDLDG